MLSGLKNLPLLSKIVFLLSLILLFIWVIPNMVEYYKNIHKSELKEKELKTIRMKYDIEGDAKLFNVDEFKSYAEQLFSRVVIAPKSDEMYEVSIDLERDEIDKFNTFLETLSLRYLVKVNGALNFSKEDKKLNVILMLKSL